MNAAGAAMLRLPPSANASISGAASALPFRVMREGRELDAHDLPMQRACRDAAAILGEEIDVVFQDGSMITLHESATPLLEQSGAVRGCVAVFVDITDRKRAERQKNLLIDELNHRAKNTLAIVQAIAHQPLRQTPDPKLFAPSFTQRLDALGRAHRLLTQTSWEGAPLSELVATALAPFILEEDRIETLGPEILIGSNIAVTFTLVLHELATNAVKHGALSRRAGRVRINWAVADGIVLLDWHETCDFPVGQPSRTGVGSRLIKRSAEQFGGSVELVYAAEGLRAAFCFPFQRDGDGRLLQSTRGLLLSMVGRRGQAPFF